MCVAWPSKATKTNCWYATCVTTKWRITSAAGISQCRKGDGYANSARMNERAEGKEGGDVGEGREAMGRERREGGIEGRKEGREFGIKTRRKKRRKIRKKMRVKSTDRRKKRIERKWECKRRGRGKGVGKL